jgi:peptidoglycan/LPS O-acetylase OafA/YrhL
MLKTLSLDPMIFKPNQPPSSRRSFDWALEGLRGYAALAVGFSHVLVGFKLDPGVRPPGFWGYLAPGSICVLLFFILSGYVIGLTTTTEFSKPAAIQYLMRRVIRLIPIYWIAIALTLPLATAEHWTTLVGNFFFVQGIAVPVIQANDALWSLSYEVVFYLLFLPIWWLKPRVTTVFALCGGLSLLGWVLPASIATVPVISSFATGFLFWLVGLWLAWNVEHDATPKKIPVFSYLCLLVAFYYIRPLNFLFQILKWSNPGAGQLNLATLEWLPICLLIIAAVTRRQFPGFKLLQVICLLIPVPHLGLVLLRQSLYPRDFVLLAVAMTVGAIALWRVRVSPTVLHLFASAGQISYAFYVVHVPVRDWIYQSFPLQGTLYSYGLRLLVWLGLSIGISILLERILQPKIRAQLSPLLLPKSSA